VFVTVCIFIGTQRTFIKLARLPACPLAPFGARQINHLTLAQPDMAHVKSTT
jgi:hypothetical protein